jgi:DnaJ-class molecular chaperone
MAKYKTVKVPGGTVRVAETLSAATNAKRGYCPDCSGNGTVTVRRKVTSCDSCNGTGRA